MSSTSRVSGIWSVTAVLWFATAVVAAAAGSVSGSVTVKGQKGSLTLYYVDESPKDVVVVLASKEVPKDAVPFIGDDVARKFKIHALVFTVPRGGQALDPQGLSLQTTKVTAEITMVREGGVWKVDKEKWSTTSK